MLIYSDAAGTIKALTVRKITKNEDVYIEIGPFIDKSDGFTPLNNVNVGVLAGVITRSYDSGSSVTHVDFTPSATAANDWGMAAVGHCGMYILKVPDSEINWLGHGRITLTQAASIVPVWEDIEVCEANDVDAEYGATLATVDVTKLGGVAQSATDLKDFADTGYDPSAHRSAADLISILGTALTETAGYIAAAFKKFFNKATPTGTVNSLPDAVAGQENGLIVVGGGGTPLTSQQTRDAMKLGPSAGASAANSIDDKLDDLAGPSLPGGGVVEG